ncbi:MAG: hypothetical protein GY757_26170 [bacterium]|nr:hypothetical protein [bacterium]
MNELKFTCLLFVLVTAAVLLPSVSLHGANAVIPGTIDNICYHTRFFYNLPVEDFFYYLNDRLLYMENPAGPVTQGGARNQLLKLVRSHNLVKSEMAKTVKPGNKMISIDVANPKGLKKATSMGFILGFDLTANGKYKLSSRPLSDGADYSRFINLKLSSIEKQLNATHHFFFKLRETEIPVPWDFEFLETITGLKVDSSSFFETMINHKQFSLLLGVLYRLSSREIDYISGLDKSSPLAAWQKIYNDRKFLMGMFLLSSSLRASGENENRLLSLPGGPGAEPFWSRLAGVDYKSKPLEFLQQLATKEDGKLNYLFVLSTFLPQEKQNYMFTGPNAAKMEELYRTYSLSTRERLNATRFPGLRSPGFHTLFFALKMKDGKFDFPLGLKTWFKILKLKKDDVTPFTLLKVLTKKSGGVKTFTEIKKFISIYTKFYHRPELLTEETLYTLYHSYENYNVLVDFVEKLPIKKPETITKLFAWVWQLEKTGKKDKVLLTSAIQSILEIFSHAAKFTPERFDYDRLIDKLVELPHDRLDFYTGIFRFFKTELKLKTRKGKSRFGLIDFALTGIENRNLGADYTDYRFTIKNKFRKDIKEILTSQETCSFSGLMEMERLLNRLVTEDMTLSTAKSINRRLLELFQLVPHPDISKSAPKYLRERVIDYPRVRLYIELNSLNQKIKKDAPTIELKKIIDVIRKDYLVYHLNHYMLTLAYALNAKNPSLRVFLNPNMVRLHDFDDHNGRTAWNYSGVPSTGEYFSEYHLAGGLSRLNLTFSGKWQSHLFGRTPVFNSWHLRSVISNLMDFYPITRISRSTSYNALLVDFGMDLMLKARDKKVMKQNIIKQLGMITSGYHYRKAVGYLSGKSKNHRLFFSELRQLGESFFKKGKYLEYSNLEKQLRAFAAKPPATIESLDRQFGNIYYHTFGNLKPQHIKLFPQDVSSLFAEGWVSGEMFDEFKIKLSWHIYKKKVPPSLMSHALYAYFIRTVPRVLCQNHINDYFSTYFTFEVFNYSHLKNIIKKLKKEGYLKLK